MEFHDLERKKIEKALVVFLDKRRPPISVRSDLDIGYMVSGQSVELHEIRPQWNDPTKIHQHPFAKATYERKLRLWKVYWRRGDLQWHAYKPCSTVPSIEEFLSVVDADEHACFFG